MWIVAVAWIYVVGLMAVTEHSIVAGIMTFFGYCVLPLSILFYLFGGRARRARRDARAGGASDSGTDSSYSSSTDSMYYGSSDSDSGSRSGDCSSDSSDSGSSDSGCSDSGGSDSSSSSD